MIIAGFLKIFLRFLSQIESIAREDNESLIEQASLIRCGVAGWRLISGSACFNYADDPIKTQSPLNAPPKRGDDSHCGAMEL